MQPEFRAAVGDARWTTAEPGSMPAATAAATTMPAAAVARRSFAAAASRGEGGKFLGQFLRAAMRAPGFFPIGRADEDFAVAPALPAMKFVNRHGWKLFGGARLRRA